MADVEHLHFKIGLSGTYWEKKPQYSILLNDSIIETRRVDAPSGEIFFIEFDRDLPEGVASLKIRLENKDWSDTVQNEDKTVILRDMLLNIKSIEIDEIPLGDLLWSETSFVGDDADRPVLTKCVDLGWNGTWTLEFSSPFYIWLLEAL
jgi:hypothetical protein